MISDILNKLERAKVSGPKRWMAKCPAHDDGTASLQISIGDDNRVLLKCFANCETEDVMKAIGVTWSEMFDGDSRAAAPAETQPPERWPVKAIYTYRDRDGTEVFQVRRMVSADTGNKTFRQFRRVGAQWVAGMDGVIRFLYRLPELAEAQEGQRVFVVEGEQCAEDIAALGLLATTSVGGAGKWMDEYGHALAGLHVVVLPDNDEPGEKHATQVIASVKPHALSVKLIRLPGLPKKGDVSDWLRAGGTKTELEALCDMPEQARPNAFSAAPTRLIGEAFERKRDRERVLKFGVSFLDDALGGIMPNDVILVGAKTGVGKTQCATIAAMTNALAGKRVHYFALEAEDREIERRVKYQIIAREHYRVSRAPIRFLEWRAGFLSEQLGRFEDSAESEARRTLANLHTFYRSGDFTSDDFSKHLSALKGETDLVVLDHLHYVDNDDKDENRGYKAMVKQIRDAALASNKPTIIVAHVRKADRRTHGLVPEIDDFHGSSDIPKIATKAIMIAPDFEAKTGDASLWSTFMHVVKCRTDSTLNRYVAQILFNARRDRYEDGYILGRLSEGGTVFNDLPPDEWPQWKRSLGGLQVVQDGRFPEERDDQ